MTVLRLQALAKINLGLYVLYRRPDGFHELRTVFQTISLADNIEVSYRSSGGPSVELVCNLPELDGPENLAARAARLWMDAIGSKARVSIRLDKRIPAGAGLGGGSSDAAAVLTALGSLVRPRTGAVLLHKLAAQLGSDVAFFLVGGRALGIGRGEEIYPLPDGSPETILLISPRVPVSTSEAYRRLSPGLTTQAWEGKIDRFCSTVCELERAGRKGQARGFQAELENDFEPVVFQMHPELKQWKARLERQGACPALLCGSGSSLFGIFADRRQALRARDHLKREDAHSFVVQTVSRTSYQARWRKWLLNRA